MKRVLLSGATGFVGANLARHLLHQGHTVHLLVRPGAPSWRLAGISAEVRQHEANLTDAATLERIAAATRPEWVFHLAAFGAYSWQTDTHQMVQTNLTGTINLLQACRRVGFAAFVNSGSSSEYGFVEHAPAETQRLEPNSHYAITKAAATLFCRHTAQQHGLHIPTLRLYSVYGPYEEPRRLIPSLILHGLRGELPPLVSPDTARDFVYADDVCDAYLRAAAQPNQEPGAIYNVGTGTQTTLHEVVEVARALFGIEAAPQWGTLERRQWDTATWVADSRKLRETLGWQPRTPFAEGFRQAAAWFREHRALLPA
jgi:dolichol-phosphate mannosyltransferase